MSLGWLLRWFYLRIKFSELNWSFFITKFYSLLSWAIPNQFLRLLFLTFLLDLCPPVVMLLDISHGVSDHLNFLLGSHMGLFYCSLKLNWWMWFQILLSSSALHGLDRARELGHKSFLVPSNESGWILIFTSCFPKSENENYYALTLNPPPKKKYNYKYPTSQKSLHILLQTSRTRN